MARYTFTCEHFDYNNFTGNEEGVSSKHTVEFRADTLETMFEQFEMFLRGAGFHFDGRLDVVNDEEDSPEWQTEEYETPTTSSWDWSVNELLKGPITLQDVTKGEDTISFPSASITISNYGAAQPTNAFFSGEDTITITGLNPAKCQVCGLDKTVMKVHNCYDDNCPKGSW